MARLLVILSLVVVSGLVIAFLALDKGLSGGSASDPTFAYVFIGVAVLLILLIATNNVNGLGLGLTGLFAAMPILFVVGMFLYTQYSWKTRPEAKARDGYVEEIKCSLRAAAISSADWKYISPRLSMLRDYGEVENPAHPRGVLLEQIETRAKIIVLPNCQFERR